MNRIRAGDLVEVRTSGERRLQRRAASGVVPGASFPIVWVCRDEEWQQAPAEAREPNVTPWPADAVLPLRTPQRA
jgi:hypothetical protein